MYICVPSLEHLPPVGVSVEILGGVDTGVESRDHLLAKIIAAHKCGEEMGGEKFVSS